MRKTIFLFALLAGTLSLQAQNYPLRARLSDPNSFSVIVIPDPQSYTKFAANQPLFELQTAWIAREIDSLRILTALCTGDLVEQNETAIPLAFRKTDQTSAEQWRAASRAFERLDNKLPLRRLHGQPRLRIHQVGEPPVALPRLLPDDAQRVLASQNRIGMQQRARNPHVGERRLRVPHRHVGRSAGRIARIRTARRSDRMGAQTGCGTQVREHAGDPADPLVHRMEGQPQKTEPLRTDRRQLPAGDLGQTRLSVVEHPAGHLRPRMPPHDGLLRDGRLPHGQRTPPANRLRR